MKDKKAEGQKTRKEKDTEGTKEETKEGTKARKYEGMKEERDRAGKRWREKKGKHANEQLPPSKPSGQAVRVTHFPSSFVRSFLRSFSSLSSFFSFVPSFLRSFVRSFVRYFFHPIPLPSTSSHRSVPFIGSKERTQLVSAYDLYIISGSSSDGSQVSSFLPPFLLSFIFLSSFPSLCS